MSQHAEKPSEDVEEKVQEAGVAGGHPGLGELNQKADCGAGEHNPQDSRQMPRNPNADPSGEGEAEWAETKDVEENILNQPAIEILGGWHGGENPGFERDEAVGNHQMDAGAAMVGDAAPGVFIEEVQENRRCIGGVGKRSLGFPKGEVIGNLASGKHAGMECKPLDGSGPRTIGAGGIADDQSRGMRLRGDLEAQSGLGFDQVAIQVNPGALRTCRNGPEGEPLGELGSVRRGSGLPPSMTVIIPVHGDQGFVPLPKNQLAAVAATVK